MAQAARKHQAEAFVLVSTDKAVRPSSVMGATKRVAEMLVRSFSRKAERTRFVTVRFGNVLGSSGSVLEIFQRQLAEGGPLTVTDAKVTRFFMTVPEAVQLILQASSMAKGGEIFVLRMGTPVKIIEMARNLIMLSGLEPDKDIKIQITGLKSGEKMDEELALDHADLKDSAHPSIMVLREPVKAPKRPDVFEVPGQQFVGLGLHRTLKDAIIALMGLNGIHRDFRVDKLGDLTDRLDGYSDFLSGEADLRSRQDFRQLREDGFGNRQVERPISN